MDVDEDLDWDEEFGFSIEDDSSNSVDDKTTAARIVGITAERFVSTKETNWDDDFLDSNDIFLDDSSSTNQEKEV